MTIPHTQNEPLDLQGLIDLAEFYHRGNHSELAYNILNAVKPETIGENTYRIHEAAIESYKGAYASALNKHDIALNHYRISYECMPDSTTALNLVNALNNCRRWDESCDLATETLDLYPNITESQRKFLFLERGHANLFLKNFSQAIEDLNLAEATDDTHSLLMVSYANMQNYQEAYESAKRVSSDFDSYHIVLAMAGFFAGALGHIDESQDFYKKARMMGKLPKEQINLLHNLAVNILINHPNQTKLQAGLELNGFLIDTADTHDTIYVELLKTKAVFYRELGDKAIAEEIFARILPRAFQEPSRYCTVFAAVAKQQYQQGNFADAIEHSTLALAGCIRNNQIPFALDHLTFMFTAASEGGYPVLAEICKRNVDALQNALKGNGQFPELEPLKLE